MKAYYFIVREEKFLAAVFADDTCAVVEISRTEEIGITTFTKIKERLRDIVDLLNETFLTDFRINEIETVLETYTLYYPDRIDMGKTERNEIVFGEAVVLPDGKVVARAYDLRRFAIYESYNDFIEANKDELVIIGQ